MQHPPHPLLRLGDLGFTAAQNRLASIAEARGMLHFFNARAALFHVFRDLKRTNRSRVLMPAFHCVSMIDPAIHAGLDVSYYRIDHRLQIDADEVLSRAGADVCAFVFVNFFGFPAAVETLLPELRRRDIAVVEDCSHSFLRLHPYGLTGGRGDYTVYSFAKLVPCGIGGGLRSKGRLFQSPTLARPTLGDSVVRTKRLLEQTIFSADERSSLKRVYLALESARTRRRRSQEPARASEPVPGQGEPPTEGSSFDALAFEPIHAQTQFPLLPRRILRNANLPDIVARRRRNYLLYAEQLAPLDAPRSVFPRLESEVCPWAYPILLADRSQHDTRLRSLGVPVWTFGDILHPGMEKAATAAAAKDARFLATHLLCLPVHQGLTPEAVTRFARTVSEAGLPAVPA